VIGKVKLAGVADHWRQSTWKKEIEILNYFFIPRRRFKKYGATKKIKASYFFSKFLTIN
jgi:hypothetical protein